MVREPSFVGHRLPLRCIRRKLGGKRRRDSSPDTPIPSGSLAGPSCQRALPRKTHCIRYLLNFNLFLFERRQGWGEQEEREGGKQVHLLVGSLTSTQPAGGQADTRSSIPVSHMGLRGPGTRVISAVAQATRSWTEAKVDSTSALPLWDAGIPSGT